MPCLGEGECSTSQICPLVGIQGGGGHGRTKNSPPQQFPDAFSALGEHVSWMEKAWHSVMFCGDRKSSIHPHVISIGDARIPLSLVSQNFTLFYIQCLGDLWTHSNYCHGKTILCPRGRWVKEPPRSPWGFCIVSWQALLLSLMCIPFPLLISTKFCVMLTALIHIFFLHYFIIMITPSFPLSKPVTARLASLDSQILWEAVFSQSLYLKSTCSSLGSLQHMTESQKPLHPIGSMWFFLLINYIIRSSSGLGDHSFHGSERHHSELAIFPLAAQTCLVWVSGNWRRHSAELRFVHHKDNT